MMPDAGCDDREALYSKLRQLSVYNGTITPELDVVYDLFLGGDDLENLLLWLHRERGVDLAEVNARDLPLNEPPQRTHTLFGRRKFKSMTVGGLLTAMKTKRWSW